MIYKYFHDIILLVIVMLDKVISVNTHGIAEFTEKKSKFISNVKPIHSEKEAIDFINKIKKEHYNATHNVFAYTFGEKNEIERQSDDGEPSGTAGMPILDLLRKENIKNVVVIVTRYYGGTLLGTGGLVRAYSKCAKLGLINAEIIEKILYTKLNIISNYNLSAKIQHEILKNNNILDDTKYTDIVEFTVFVQKQNVENFIKNMINSTNNNIKIKQEKDLYCFYMNNKFIKED